MAELIEVVDINTSDGIGINGAYWEPTGGTARGVDAWLLLPGMSGAFYSQVQRPFARALSASGYPVLTLSTRGHDTLWIARPSGRPMGVAGEILKECVFDIRASLDELARRGHQRIGLLGHSLGCIKSYYFLGNEGDSRITAFAAVSGPRFGRSTWDDGPVAGQVLASLDEAKRSIANGDGDKLGTYHLPQGPSYKTANSFVDWYDDDTYSPLRNAPGIRVPMIALRGSEEPTMMPDGWQERVLEAATRATPKTQTTITGADHFYSATTAPLAIAAIVDFVSAL